MPTSRLRLIAIAVLLCGCQSARAGTVPPADTQPPSFYCERSHTNHAWGYQHRGIFVDATGAVFYFQHARSDQAMLRASTDSVTEQALLARLAPGRRPAGSVARREMAERYRQAQAAREGTLTERRRRGADMGATVRRCYLPDSAGIYRAVLLRQTGDWEQQNTSPAAAQLSSWLDSLAMVAR